MLATDQSVNQFIGVIVWDRDTLSFRAGGSCIRHLTKIIILIAIQYMKIIINIYNNIINIKDNNKNYYIPECICKKYSSNTLLHPPYLIKNYGNLTGRIVVLLQ